MTYKNFEIAEQWPAWTAKSKSVFLYTLSKTALINLIDKKAK
jgi:hypothetical protein